MTQGSDFIGVGIISLCHDGKGNFVMAKRGKNARDEHGNWDICGGGLEFGDNVEDRLKIEVKEEFCADVINYEFLGFRDVHRIQSGQPTHWIDLDFKVLVDPAQVKNGEPHKFDEIGWFTLKNVPEPTHSQWPKFLEKYKEKLG
ncbi:MAG: NUDIX domain-containing protein [Patescibacteria group bacterium]